MQNQFRGWWIVGVGFYAEAITIGLTIFPFGLFALPIVDEFDASMSSFQLGLGVFILVMTASGSVIGGLLDRGSIRAIMATGSLMLSASFVAMSFATTLWHLGLLFGLVGAIGVTMAGPLAATTSIAKWFDRKRGQAVGIASMGPPAGGLILMPLTGWLLATLEWRHTLLVFAALAASIAPLALLIVRNLPADLAQEVDGEASFATGKDQAVRSASREPKWTTPRVLRARNFWTLALGIGIVFGLGGGWNANAPPFGADLGYSGQQMSLLIGIAAGLGIPATLIFGTLADRLDNRNLLLIAVALQGCGLLVLSSEPGPFFFTTAILLFGFAGGGLLPVYASLIGRLFGADAFGSVMGLAGLVMLPFGFAAPIVAGALRDASGSYVSTLLLFSVAFAIGAALIGLIRVHASVRIREVRE